MKKTQRIIFRNRVFERIVFRQTSKTINNRNFQEADYRLEMRKVDADSEQVVFEAKFVGLPEITETTEEIRFKFSKKDENLS